MDQFYELLAPFMTWKAFGAVFGASLIFAARKSLVRVGGALIDVATEKLVIAGLQRLAKSTQNELDDQIIEAVKKSLEPKE